MIREITVVEALKAHSIIEQLIASNKLVNISTAFKLARLNNDLNILGETTHMLLTGIGAEVDDSVGFADNVLGNIVEVDTYGLTVSDLESEGMLEITTQDATALLKLLG